MINDALASHPALAPRCGPNPARRFRLLEVVRQRAGERRYSPRTEKAYVFWIRRYVMFHARAHPRDLGPLEVRAFLSHLALVDGVAASTQNQALAALTFLYGAVLQQPLERIEGIAPARRSRYVPVVLTPQEIRAILRRAAGNRAPARARCRRQRATTWVHRGAPEGHRLEPGAIVACGLESEPAEFGRDVLGGLVVALASTLSAHHGIVGNEGGKCPGTWPRRIRRECACRQHHFSAEYQADVAWLLRAQVRGRSGCS